MKAAAVGTETRRLAKIRATVPVTGADTALERVIRSAP
jgi:hypothetical protein